MTTAPAEWMTVAEAARRLGLSDRHARRLADRLAEGDRFKKGTSPLRVRVAALALLWERESQHDFEALTAADTANAEVGEDAVSRARLEERLEAAEGLVVELRDDKKHLQEIIQREQENHRRLLDRLSDERRDQRLMHARPLPTLPFRPEPEPPGEADEADEVDDLDAPLPFPHAELPPAPEPPPPNFWQRLAHWVSD